MMIAVAALLLAAADVSPVGLYETQQIEMVGALELKGNGRFRYVFDYGAVSESGAGQWTVAPGGVLLTSTPRPADADPERSWAPFGNERLTLDGFDLFMHRYDAEIRFVRVRP